MCCVIFSKLCRCLPNEIHYPVLLLISSIPLMGIMLILYLATYFKCVSSDTLLTDNLKRYQELSCGNKSVLYLDNAIYMNSKNDFLLVFFCWILLIFFVIIGCVLQIVSIRFSRRLIQILLKGPLYILVAINIAFDIILMFVIVSRYAKHESNLYFAQLVFVFDYKSYDNFKNLYAEKTVFTLTTPKLGFLFLQLFAHAYNIVPLLKSFKRYLRIVIVKGS